MVTTRSVRLPTDMLAGHLPWIVVQRCKAVVSAALWLAALDLLVSSLAHDQPVTLHAVAALLCSYVLILSALGLGVLLLSTLSDLSWKRWVHRGRSGRALWFSGLFAVASLWPAVTLGDELAGGDWISQQWFADHVRYGVGAGIALGVACATAHVVFTESKRAWPFVWVAFATAAAYLNSTVLVGLYPAFHVALFYLSAVLSLLAAHGLLRRFKKNESAWANSWFLAVPVAVCVSLAAYCGFALESKSRSLVLRSSPQLAQILPFFVPRADKNVLRQAIAFEEFREHKAPSRTKLGRKPQNVILITVDALRADALAPVRSETTSYQKAGDTPFFDQWLTSAYRFSNAYAQASRTNRSVPATLYSRETYEEVVRVGVPLATRARQVGLKPLAVLPDWYILPNSGDAASLLEGFEWVETYLRNQEQHRFRPLVMKALAEAGSEPFFLWLHYFGMHEPYYIGKKEKHPKNATPGEKYRAALRYMDKEFARIHREMSERDLLENTLIVLMADHGEFLGERGLEHHGIGIYEEEMHVPLALWVPGAESGDVEALVGNIDIVPTIFDLLEDSNHVSTKGQSFVPEMNALEEESDRALYVTSSNGKRMGLITQDHKLQFDRETGSFSVFLRTDAAQAEDLLGDDPLLDRSLILEFVSRNPRLYQEELEQQATRDAIAAQLEQSTAESSLRHLEFLLLLAALSEDQKLLEVAKNSYEASPQFKRKLLFLSHLYATDQESWSARAQALLKQYRDRPEERLLARELARLRMTGLDPAFVSARFSDVAAHCSSPLAAAWLPLAYLLSGSRTYEAPLVEFLKCAEKEDPKGKGLLPRVVGSLESLEVKSSVELEKRILPLLRHRNDWIVVTAVRALGSVGGTETIETLTGILEKRQGAPRRTKRVIEASILALARLRGAELTPQLVEWGEDSSRTFPVIRALEQVGDERALPFLQEISEGKGLWMSRTARAALQTVRRRLAEDAP